MNDTLSLIKKLKKTPENIDLYIQILNNFKNILNSKSKKELSKLFNSISNDDDSLSIFSKILNVASETKELRSTKNKSVIGIIFSLPVLVTFSGKEDKDEFSTSLIINGFKDFILKAKKNNIVFNDEIILLPELLSSHQVSRIDHFTVNEIGENIINSVNNSSDLNFNINSIYDLDEKESSKIKPNKSEQYSCLKFIIGYAITEQDSLLYKLLYSQGELKDTDIQNVYKFYNDLNKDLDSFLIHDENAKINSIFTPGIYPFWESIAIGSAQFVFKNLDSKIRYYMDKGYIFDIVFSENNNGFNFKFIQNDFSLDEVNYPMIVGLNEEQLDLLTRDISVFFEKFGFFINKKTLKQDGLVCFTKTKSRRKQIKKQSYIQ